MSTLSYQLPDLLALTRHFELRSNKHCRSVTLASEEWFLEKIREEVKAEAEAEAGKGKGTGTVRDDTSLGLGSLLSSTVSASAVGLGSGSGLGSIQGQGPGTNELLGSSNHNRNTQGQGQSLINGYTPLPLITILPTLKIGLLASLCFPTCDSPQLRLVVDFWTIVVLEDLKLMRGMRRWSKAGNGDENGDGDGDGGRDGDRVDEELVKGWWGCASGSGSSNQVQGSSSSSSGSSESKSDVDVDVLEVLKGHAHFKHLHPQLARLSSTMSSRWNDQFTHAVLAFRRAQFQAVRYGYRCRRRSRCRDEDLNSNTNSNANSDPKKDLDSDLDTPDTYLLLRRNLSGLPILFCLIEAVEGLGSGLDGVYLGREGRGEEGGSLSLEKIKELVADVIVLSWDIFSYNIDQFLSPTPLNIVHILLGQRKSGAVAGSGSASGSGSGSGSVSTSGRGYGTSHATSITPIPSRGSVLSAINQAGTLVRQKFEEYCLAEEEVLEWCGNSSSNSGLGEGGGADGGGGGDGPKSLSSILSSFLWGSASATSALSEAAETHHHHPYAGANANGVSSDSDSARRSGSGSGSEQNLDNSTLVDLSLFLQHLQDFITGCLNWSYETEMFFGNKGDSVRGYGWVFLMKPAWKG
ncbi:hypothetical protein D9758_016057 [Tetrapyrgos nigripes]|uniref:Uncharacterized protein n=1 Tax=Tetrapyrgos nigripes TaxID=182062 RepID=A0A8H5C8T8_9AGAR|nr:hypothetical protein D9758_016057 [Tetrapyrgos nigripes]